MSFLFFPILYASLAQASSARGLADTLVDRGLLSAPYVDGTIETLEHTVFDDQTSLQKDPQLVEVFDDYLEEFLLVEIYRCLNFLDLALRQAEANYFVLNLPEQPYHCHSG